MSLQHLLLGLLRDQPLSGYDLNKAFQDELYVFWMTEQSQIYRALYGMHKSGWVEVETIIQHDNPNKKVYFLTPEGHAELNRWLREADGSDVLGRLKWIIPLLFGGELSGAAICRLLEERRTEFERRLATLRGDNPPEFDEAFEFPYRRDNPRQEALRHLIRDYLIERCEAEIAWVKQAIAAIRDLDEPEHPIDAPPFADDVE